VGERRRIVLDANVFVAAVTSREGVSARLLLAARAGRSQLVASPLLLDELVDALSRPKFQRYLSIEDACRFVDAVRALVVIVDDPRRGPIPSPMIPATTSSSSSPRLQGPTCSFPPDLTTVQRPGLVVMTPRSFLESLDEA